MNNKILLIDDHEIIRVGITALINKYIPEFEVVGTDSLKVAEELIQKQECCLIILDVNLPNEHTLAFVEKMKKKRINIPILMLSALAEQTMAQSFLEAGAKGYIQKDESYEEILKAIKIVLSGKVYMSEAINKMLVERSIGYAFKKKDDVLNNLTLREVEILTLMRDGKRSKEMTDILGLSISAIYLYKRRIFKKLKIKDDMELARVIEKFF